MMTSAVSEQVMQGILAVKVLYHRLVVVVGEVGSGKTKILHAVAAKKGVAITNVNLCVSRSLLELSTKQRALHVSQSLHSLTSTNEKLMILDNLELLFDPNLKLDPLRILQGLSRNRTIVASWSGKHVENRLYYAEQGHPEYRSYDDVDAWIVGIVADRPDRSTGEHE